ncbi:MAG: hypothetical protein IPK76_01350 [Lewinellaceae bacterium]|nr:hypothetical protein [Lewinellaceae bacterium]
MLKTATPGGYIPAVQNALADRPDIAGVASSELSLGANSGWSRSGFDYKGEAKDVFEYFIDPDYMQVLGIQLPAGRNFDLSLSSDTVSAVIVNETMVRDFGWTPDNAVGRN